MASATAHIILACRSSTFAGKGGKYILYLKSPHKKKFSGVKLGDRVSHDIGPTQPTHRFGKCVEIPAHFSIEVGRRAVLLEA
jgi:hypothetical protein